MIINEYCDKVLTAEELKNSVFMNYDILYIKNVKRNHDKTLLECSVIAMDDAVGIVNNQSPKDTEEIFLTDKGRFNAFGLIGLTW